MTDNIKGEWDKTEEASEEKPESGFGAGAVTGLYTSLTGFVGTATYMASNRSDINLGQNLYPYLTDQTTVTMGGVLATGYLTHSAYKCMRDYIPPTKPIRFGLGATTALALSVPLFAITLEPKMATDFIIENMEFKSQVVEDAENPTLDEFMAENNLEIPEI